MTTEESVKLKLSRLLNETKALREATNRLTAKLEGFSKIIHEDAFYSKINIADFQFPARPVTDEPKSPIREAVYEFGDQKDLSDATRTLVAISKAIDGALRDVRSSRIFLENISKDADSSALFREWQSQNGQG